MKISPTQNLSGLLSSCEKKQLGPRWGTEKSLTRRHGEDQEEDWELNSVNKRPTSERKTPLHHREITEKKIEPLEVQ